VIYRRLELHFGWRIRVIGWKLEGKLEGHAGIAGVRRAGEGGGPFGEIGFRVGEGGNGGSGGEHHGHQFGLKSAIGRRLVTVDRSRGRALGSLTSL